MAAVKARRAGRVPELDSDATRYADFDARETRVRSRLERLAQKRDTAHRLNVREALRDRETAKQYAAGFGATIGDGVPIPDQLDGIFVSPVDDDFAPFVWLREMLSTLTFADCTSEYSPTDDPPSSVRLIRVRHGRAIGSLIVVDRDIDGQPDSLYHVWVAGHHRGRGVGRELVTAARAQWSITSIVGPLNTARGAAKVAARLAPDLQVTA